MLCYQLLYRSQIVIWCRKGIIGNTCGYTRYILDAECGYTTTRFNQEHIGMSVITAFKLDKFILSGIPARQAYSRHTGFGTTVHHTDQVYVFSHRYDQFCHLYFQQGWRSE
ncbi:hypothetical protein D3C86_1676400 [compost metagenome]